MPQHIAAPDVEAARSPALCDPRAVRPARSDIAVPPFAPTAEWVGVEPAATERITARGPLLVAFVEVGELSSVRALPLIAAWAGRYAPAGLTVLGVHSPRNEIARATEDLAASLARLEVPFPVANDRDYRAWHDYGCKGWPSLFLWRRGGALDFVHLGLDGIEETEEAIREALGGADGERELPAPVAESVQPPAGELAPPSDEVFPGGSHDVPWEGQPGEPLEVEYSGAGAWAALDGSGSVTVNVDGDPGGAIAVTAPGVYALARHPHHGIHEVRLDLDGPVRVWSLAFSAGRPGR
jgi:hypothetical protein